MRAANPGAWLALFLVLTPSCHHADNQPLAGTGPIQKLAGDGFIVAFIISPDGSAVASLDQSDDLWLGPISGGALRKIATNVQIWGTNETFAAFSPDGTRCSFFTNWDQFKGTLGVASVAGGTPVQIATNAAYFTRFTPDGSHIAFLESLDGDAGTLEIAPTSGGPPLQVASRIPASTFDWLRFSPDGTHFMFLDGSRSLELGTTSGEAPPLELATIVDPDSWSPDGSHLLFLTNTSAYEVASFSGGAAVQLPGLGGYQWSPDGKLIAYPAGSGIGFFAPSGDAPQEIPTTLDIFGWSPDGSRLLLYDRQGTIAVASVSGGAPVTIATGANRYSVVWSPDGSHLAFLVNSDAISGTLEVAPAEGGPPTRLADHSSEFVAFSPDGSRLAFLSNYDGKSGTLEVAAVSGGNLVQIGTGAPFIARFSPDGSNIAWLGGAGQLTMSSVSSGASKKITDDPTSLYFYFSADGQYLVFSESGGCDNCQDKLSLALVSSGATQDLCDRLERWQYTGNAIVWACDQPGGIYADPIP